MTEPLALPDWIVMLVGQLVLENEAMRRELSTRQGTQSTMEAAEGEASQGQARPPTT